jgi:hypothetical protein
MVSIMLHAQDCIIPLRPIVIQKDNNSLHATKYLTNRVKSLTCMENSIGSLENAQFNIVIDYDIIDKQIVSGAPNKIIYNINLSMHIVDLKGQKLFATYSKELHGIGDNETKALINTFQKININNTEIKSFIIQGKKKIIEYYDNHYLNIIKGAQTLVATRNFDAAIYNLLQVPECCKGYDIVKTELMLIFQQFVNQHCNENLAQARAAWTAAPNSEGAATASIYLSEIYPDAECYADAVELANEIKKQMGEEWKFMMRQYADNISLERQRINAMRDIGIAYANRQTKIEITNIFWK